MDFLHLHTFAFPILRGSISKLPDERSDYCWCIEIYCAGLFSPEEQGSDLDWVAGTEPYLYAQLLPLRVSSPDELVGQHYAFPQSPEDDPADWEPDQWPFFCLYLLQHEYVYPVSFGFTAKRDGKYRIEIEGKLPACQKSYDIRAEAWLDWEP
jgi:hypothetical protein